MTKELIVENCTDCPFCETNDFCEGFTCKLDKELIIKENKYAYPIDPEWCPLKKQDILVKYFDSCSGFKVVSTEYIQSNRCKAYKYIF